MQQLAHLQINDQKIKILIRLSSWKATHVSIKLRKSGEDGPCMSDESKYLKEHPQALSDLLAGKVVKC